MRSIESIMYLEIPYVTAKDNVFEVATIMKKHRRTFVPVLQEEKVIGLITDRDIVIHHVAEKKPNSAKVTDLMRKNFAHVTLTMTISKAKEKLIQECLSELPVVNGNDIVGYVKLQDVLNS
jgi:CBS domain-containing protein